MLSPHWGLGLLQILVLVMHIFLKLEKPKMYGDEGHPKDLLGEEKYDNDSSIHFHLTFSGPTSSYARWSIPLF
jgi:hypothetical protein